ncbi:hypothetical protein HDU98_010632 [Podochytrium sp. JEL0797]|nr:hypothetical protein HDU98_010632 [Podochytrium sp. JEL0797]
MDRDDIDALLLELSNHDMKHSKLHPKSGPTKASNRFNSNDTIHSVPNKLDRGNTSSARKTNISDDDSIDSLLDSIESVGNVRANKRAIKQSDANKVNCDADWDDLDDILGHDVADQSRAFGINHSGAVSKSVSGSTTKHKQK